MDVERRDDGGLTVEVDSHRLTAVAPWDDLQAMSHQWMCDRSSGFLTKFLTSPPLSLPLAATEAIAPTFRHFWATIAAGDPQFDFSHLPPEIRQVMEVFNAVGEDGQPQKLDNQARLVWDRQG